MSGEKLYDYLIVGAGLYGATFARLATDRGYRCLVIDRRAHLGGNLYCECREGINVHAYGPHIFHTSSRRVWEFVNRFTEFNRFTLMTIADFRGRLYNLPFNMNTFHQMWGARTPKEAKAIIESQRERPTSARNLEEQAISMVGSDLYQTLVKGYTEKQWGRRCSDLPAFIIRRLPVRFTFDNNYFDDAYQGIPIGGYMPLVEQLLKGSDTKTGVDFFDGLDRNWRKIASKLLYTGKIDDFYHNCFGRLQYRSLRFEHETLDMPNYQGVALKNFTSVDVPYTRIVEHKHFESFGDAVYANPRTVITREYPEAYTEGREAYYPINDEENTRLYSRYRNLAKKEKDVIFGGRLAEYKYYDMAPLIGCVLEYWDSVSPYIGHNWKNQT